MYKLMIVDDEPLMRRGIKALLNLEKLGIEELIEASNGEEALILFKEKKPDIVLADINMPKMDGLTFAKYILEINRNTKIAMITGYDYFDYAHAAIKIGVDDYILKPVSKKDIEEVIIKLIKKIKADENSNLVSNYMHDMIGEIGDHDSNSQRELIKKSFIENAFNSDFSLSKLASELKFSSGYLSGLFKKIYGHTFQEYLETTRLERAKFILLTTDLRNYEIAEKIGFDDVNYFSTRFKRKYGITPKQYKLKKGDENENKK